jgi:hypothetical protein
MGEIVNLRRARKAREKRAKDDQARRNRIAHGRRKTERELTAAQTLLETAKLDAHRRDSETDDRG